VIEKENINKKIKAFIERQYPQLSESELEKITAQFVEFGYFVVRLYLRERQKPQKLAFREGSDQMTPNSPP